MKKISILFIMFIVIVSLAGCKKEEKAKVMNDYESDEVITAVNHNNKYPGYRHFGTYKELNEFVVNSLKENYIYPDVSKFSPNWKSSKSVRYEKEVGISIINPIIIFYCNMRDEKLGVEKIGQRTFGLPYSMEMVLYPLNGEYKQLDFKKYHCNGNYYNLDNLITITAGDKKIGEIYYSAKFEISLDYFRDLFTENMTMLIK